jgi:hypothetical protein
VSEDEDTPRRGRRGVKKNGRHGIPTNENVIQGVFEERSGKATAPPPPPGQSDLDGDHRRRAYLRLGKRWTEVFNDVKFGHYTWEEFVAGLDNEELARGQLKDKDGTFRGRPPSMIPRAFYNACVRELMDRGSVRWRANYVGAIDVMTQIAGDPTVKPEVRLKAAQFVVERIEGKVPERIIVTEADPWQEGIDGLLTDVEDATIAHAQQYLARSDGEDTSGG